MICHFDASEVRNINLYVVGSEGLDVCHHCEMQIVAFARGLRSLAARVKGNTFRAVRSRSARQA
jgi:hypothetical protein